ncbi:B12-binding domain-containing radical SAM protein [Thermodesulfobacteriota bacterium]
MNASKKNITVVLIALYRFQNFPIRIMHALLERMEGVSVHTIFFQNFNTNAVRHPSQKEEELFKKQIIKLNPDIVGLSVYSPFESTAKRLTKIIKDHSSALTVWGGIHPTLYPENCIKEVDLLCVGEGEGALADLVRAIRDNKDYRHIDNLWTKTDDGVIRNPMRQLIQDLDALPFPAYGRNAFYFIASGKITTTDPNLSDSILNVMPARGCPFACSYCVNSLLRPMYKHLGPYVRRRSVQNVIHEIKGMLAVFENKKKIIEFHDENFGTDDAWLAEFETLYVSEIGLPFKVQYNPTIIKSGTIGRLVKTGLHRIKFGIEAGADAIRNQIFNRPGKNSDFLNLIHQITDYNVKIRYDLIADNPYDTVESLRETIDLLLKLPKPLRFNLYSLQYFPGYTLTERAIKDGFVKREDTTIDRLEKKMARNWAFVPKLFPFTTKQILQNIIWLYVYGRTSDKTVRRAALVDSFRSKLNLIGLNGKAVFYGKIHNVKRRFKDSG